MVRSRSAIHVLTTALRLIARSAASSSSSLTIHAGIVSVIRFSSGGMMLDHGIVEIDVVEDVVAVVEHLLKLVAGDRLGVNLILGCHSMPPRSCVIGARI